MIDSHGDGERDSCGGGGLCLNQCLGALGYRMLSSCLFFRMTARPVGPWCSMRSSLISRHRRFRDVTQAHECPLAWLDHDVPEFVGGAALVIRRMRMSGRAFNRAQRESRFWWRWHWKTRARSAAAAQGPFGEMTRNAVRKTAMSTKAGRILAGGFESRCSPEAGRVHGAEMMTPRTWSGAAVSCTTGFPCRGKSSMASMARSMSLKRTGSRVVASRPW
jgi:hypothetical protein